MFNFGTVGAVLLVINSVFFSESATKFWLRSTAINHRDNWLDGKEQEECDGLVFPENVHSVIWLDLLEAKKIVLPTTGQIFLHEDQDDIILEEQSVNVMNCVKLREMTSYDWYDPGNWENPSLRDNVAVPHLERVPCRDDVVFTMKEYSGTITFSEYNHHVLPLTSFKWGNEHWTTEDWNLYGQQGIMKEIFYEPPPIAINENYNNSNQRCYSIPSYIVCQYVEETEDHKCLNPILPLGFCTKICGVQILVRPNVDLDDIKKILKEYSYYSETHASAVRMGLEDFHQMVFTEKDFTGSSLDEAEAFYHKLTQVIGEGEIIMMKKSGPYFVKGKALQNTLGIFFGSLCVVIIVLGGLLLRYYSNFTANHLRNRIMNGRPLSSVFATFNRDTVGLHYQRQASESSLHLVENFENPMYGKETPASSHSDVTATTTTDEVPLQEVVEVKLEETKEGNENSDEE